MQLNLITQETGLLTVRELAQKIWHDHYVNIIGLEQVEYMLKKMYDLGSLKKQQQEGHLFYLLEIENNPVGFISIKKESNNDWFLNKLYVDTQLQRSGLGAFAVSQIISLQKMDSLRLQVNRQNYKAINFYFKMGFIIEQVADFDIGDGYFMNDFIMRWQRVLET